MNDSAKSNASEDHAKRSVDELDRLSGQGNSVGWKFDREEIHQRKEIRGTSAAEAGSRL